MSRVSVLGAGAFGTALAAVIARSGRPVQLWGRDAAQIAAMRQTRENSTYLPGARLPDQIIPTDDLIDAMDADVLILAIPTQSLRAAATGMARHFAPGTALVAAAKGIEQHRETFVTAILAESIPGAAAAVMSGPSFATDIMRGLPTAVTLAAPDLDRARHLAEVVSGPGLRIYHTDDVVGVEIGGAAKNVLAIAAGIVVGAGLGESARAAIIARGFAELRRFASGLGARPETLMGLSGLGDLVLTASSPQSRNFALGLGLGAGRPLAEAMGSKLAEGAFTAPALVRMATERSVDMPISTAVAAILAGKLSVREAMTRLVDRPQKSEV